MNLILHQKPQSGEDMIRTPGLRRHGAAISANGLGLGVMAVSLLLVLQCGPVYAPPTAPAASSATPPVASVAPASPVASAPPPPPVASVAPASPATSAPPAASRDGRLSYEPRTIRCGNALCEVGKQKCCGFDGNPAASFCTSRTPEGVYEGVEQAVCYTDEQGRSTVEHWEEWGGVTLKLCDDSADCAAGLTCRDAYLHPESSKWSCGRSGKGKDELCVPEAPCRTPGTECRDGKCRIPPTKVGVSCEAQSCAGVKPICCVVEGRASCTTATACRSAVGKSYVCTKPSQCAPGQWCALTLMGSVCTGKLEYGHGGALCEGDADCRGFVQARGEAFPGLEGSTVRCGNGPEPWLKACEIVE